MPSDSSFYNTNGIGRHLSAIDFPSDRKQKEKTDRKIKNRHKYSFINIDISDNAKTYYV